MEPQDNSQTQTTPGSSNVATGDQSKNTNNQLESVFSLYPQSWQALKIAFGPLIRLAIRPFLALLPMILVIMIQTIARANGEPNTLVNIISIVIGVISVAMFILYAIRIAPASAKVQLEAVRGNKVQPKEALDATDNMVADYFLASILSALLILGGTILFIVPGLFMLRRYILVGYHLVDNNLSAMDAMRRSTEYSKTYSSAHWGLVGLQVVMIIVSYLPLVGGILSLILTIAYYNVNAVRYEQIKGIS